MRGQAGIFIVIGILFLVFLGFLFYMGYFNFKKTTTNYNPQPTPLDEVASSAYNLSNDPKYQEVKKKYNLSEEQLQILSTVNPEDNE